jgi:hypothetical protein
MISPKMITKDFAEQRDRNFYPLKNPARNWTRTIINWIVILSGILWAYAIYKAVGAILRLL